MAFSTFDENLALSAAAFFNSGSSPGIATMINPTTRGFRLDTIMAVNEDVVDHVVSFLTDNGGGAVRIGSATIPAGAGFLGAAPVDVLADLLPATTNGLVLAGLFNLEVYCETAVTLTNKLTIFAMGGIF